MTNKSKRKVKELKHHPENSNMYILSDLDSLQENIEDNGLLVPLVVDQFNQVISGNRRLECIIRLGWETVDVHEIEVKEEDDIKFLIYSFNKQRKKTIGEIIQEILMLKEYFSVGSGYRKHVNKDGTYKRKDWTKSVSKELGISTGTIQHYLMVSNYPEFWNDIDCGERSVSGTSKFIERREKEEKEKKKKILKIENLIHEDYKLYNKSSDKMDEVQDGIVQTIFTSPPYYGLRVYGKKGLGNEDTSQEFVENLSRHLDDCHRVLNDRGSMFLNLGDTYVDGCLQSIPHRVVLDMIKRKGWILKNTIIWTKPNPKPNSTKRGLSPTYEYIFHLVKTLDYIYQPTLIPTKGSGKKATRPNDRSELSMKDSNKITVNEFKNMGDFLTEDIIRVCVVNQNKFRESGGDHPAMFPENLVTPFILQTSNEGDLILDPFMGSGTTMDVGLELGRKVIGYEINPDYCNLMDERLRKRKAS